ncbi:uncharacterized protein CC84DRAFT_557518 [Paraphaeosphaeria sporulosa]|uniref:Uncharacterized protein n=1 Tax=Paraphaeosphaeria sporulosa TaxID=1460663 RepID=A0A177CKX0_9PLEO|nr:uncharacterized protein CC84DRAFT_557518 [Paraphaeosphaeria sporulosa]OAG08153.1 hypothetical protein CC84DRAFT_557518 [Paraphaeosphaeria sporulosa]
MLLLVGTPGGCFIPIAFRSPGWVSLLPFSFSRLAGFGNSARCFSTRLSFGLTSMRAGPPGPIVYAPGLASFYLSPLTAATGAGGIPFLYLPFSSSCSRGRWCGRAVVSDTHRVLLNVEWRTSILPMPQHDRDGRRLVRSTSPPTTVPGLDLTRVAVLSRTSSSFLEHMFTREWCINPTKANTK